MFYVHYYVAVEEGMEGKADLHNRGLGRANTVVWNDIHHKTLINGSP